ncbi:MAG: CHRD domain-containing protein [candidate division Zixibacteria bacterium]|nr:CHRD domain-containing protein [candidate division Zixibacteria bacterium]MDH3938433.1 CHRD domain-containing protein [candidate division Zixibacteria bacterium]
MPGLYRKAAFLAAILLAVFAFSNSVHATIHHIDVGNFFFAPTGTTVAPGDTVRWTFVGGSHTTTSEVTSPKAWDSGIMPVSDSFDVVFSAGDGPGPFPYLCSVHPFSMKDTIFVTAAPAEPTIFAFKIDEAQAAACAGTGSLASGFGVAILSADSTEVSFHIEHDVSSVTAAHVHFAPACTNGGVSFAFTSPTSPIVETWSVTSSDVTNLMAGGLYINIHSSTFPAGEIRGQVEQQTHKMAFTLDEAQADGGAGTGSFASGVFTGELNASATELSFTVTHDVSNVSDGHIHLGAPGAVGPIRFVFSGLTSPINETWMLTAADVINFLAGDLYVNLHTTANPSGEIRGQLVAGEIVFTLGLDEAQADGGNGTGSSATGFCVATLNSDTKELTVYCEHDVAGPNDAHIHLGAPGVSGPIVKAFTSPVSPIFETFLCDDADYDAILASSTYINIHSASFPAGEIRGQIDLDADFEVTFGLDESEADACGGTGSPATGSSTVTLKPGGKELTVSLTHDVAGAVDGHIHLAPECVNGAVQFGFTSFASPITEIWYLSDADVINLLQKELYINIHSASFPAGEIRGQIDVDVAAWFCGDIDNSGSPAIDISDLVYLVDFMFTGGPPPVNPGAADLNGDGVIDISDLVWLVDFMFTGGPPPTC